MTVLCKLFRVGAANTLALDIEQDEEKAVQTA